ncbi:MAG: response regulator, partial [Chloroflexota bacterium]
MTDKVIPFTVVKHLPIGLKVQLRDGRTGVIRIRETSWTAEDRRRWQELYPLEWGSQAVLISDDNDRLELSLRLAENDPWEDVPGRYQRGQVVRGIVTGVVTYGVFVEISTGVRGLLHTSQFPKELEQGALEIFWPGDHVLAKVLHVDVKRRRISLGLARPQPLVHHSGEGSGHQKSKMSPSKPVDATPPRASLERFLGSDGPQNHILVIEDDPEQATAISTWLQKVGQRVDIAYCGGDGLALLEKEIPDIALVDLGLPDTNGIELVRDIHRRWPVIRCVLATDWARADEHSAELEVLQSLGVIFLLKPLLPDDLVDMLLETDGDDQPSSDRELQLALRSELSTPDLAKKPLLSSTRILLEQCRRRLGFDAAILFALDTVQRTVQMVESQGDGLIDMRALPSLIYSPVRDVAEDRDQVLITELREKDEGRFQYLLEFYPLVACIGVPVPSGVALRHALMLFDNRSRAISEGGIAYVEAVALVIGALLDRQAAQEQAILVQRTTLLGHLTRGLVHEINHRISGLYTRLSKLEDSLEKINQSIASGNNVETGI